MTFQCKICVITRSSSDEILYYTLTELIKMFDFFCSFTTKKNQVHILNQIWTKFSWTALLTGLQEVFKFVRNWFPTQFLNIWLSDFMSLLYCVPSERISGAFIQKYHRIFLQKSLNYKLVMFRFNHLLCTLDIHFFLNFLLYLRVNLPSLLQDGC